jgi:Carboxypeptidase regulatory-like domain
MRKHNFWIGMLGVALFAPALLAAQQEVKAPIVIHVTEPTGSGVARANVQVVPGPTDPHGKIQTDEKGSLTLQLAPGGYCLFVRSPGFKTASQHFDVSAPEKLKGAAQEVVVKLQIGPTGSPMEIYPKDSLVLSDIYRAPVALSPAEIGAMPHVNIKVHNAHADADETYSGVPLETLLAKINAPMGKELRGEAMTTYALAEGSDGYSVVLSLAEVDPAFHSGQVIVADARDGQPLGKNGPFQLIVAEDKRPARWVHNLDFIGLQQAH